MPGSNPIDFFKYVSAFLALLFLMACVTIAKAETLQDSDLRQVRFIPHWSPQAQFAGFYVARDKGFYSRRGIEVEILRGGPNNPASKALAEGRAEFASMFLGNGLILRSSGVPVVNIGQLVQRSALMLVAKKTSGILSLIDLDGRSVSIWPEFSAQPLAFFRRLNLNVDIVQQGYSLNLFQAARLSPMTSPSWPCSIMENPDQHPGYNDPGRRKEDS